MTDRPQQRTEGTDARTQTNAGHAADLEATQ